MTSALSLGLVAIGCGGSTSSAGGTGEAAAISARAIGHGSAELNCKTFPFDNSGDPDWRRNSYSFGPFGVSRNFAAGGREADGYYHSKAPMLVEGHRSVLVTVPPRERDRVAIEVLKPNRPVARLTLKPCAGKARTMWAAGFVLDDLHPVTLEVQIGDRSGLVRVGPPETQH